MFPAGNSGRLEDITKRLIVTTAITLGLASICNTAIATERYIVDLSNGFAVMGIVAPSPAELVKAQREAVLWENQRHLGLDPQTIAAVVIDNSAEVAATRVQPGDPGTTAPSTAVAVVQNRGDWTGSPPPH
jgi:hypothetical protein